MEVIFISGESGVGKDTFARKWSEDKGLSYFTTGNNDKSPFDDYMGQDVIIWSDARDDVYKPSQLHTMLDNHWASTQKARFVDQVLNCKYFIITSVKPLDEWYKNFYSKEKEDIKQLYRRIRTWYKMDRNVISCKVYNQSENEYIYTDSYINTYGHTEEYLDSDDKRSAFAGAIKSSGMVTFDEYLNNMIDKFESFRKNGECSEDEINLIKEIASVAMEYFLSLDNDDE